MKVKATFEVELPDDLHGDDIENMLKANGESINSELISWE